MSRFFFIASLPNIEKLLPSSKADSFLILGYGIKRVAILDCFSATEVKPMLSFLPPICSRLLSIGVTVKFEPKDSTYLNATLFLNLFRVLSYSESNFECDKIPLRVY